MSEKRPPACHYDRTLGGRVTRDHRDDCPTKTDQADGACPAAGRGCAPCTAPHCISCGRNHATNDRPKTCKECVDTITADLTDIQAAYTALAIEALEAGHDGRLVAAAPIPGGDAAVLIGPTVRLNVMRTYRGWTAADAAKDHRHSDPMPPLAILAQWEDIYRAFLDHRSARRASVSGAIAYLKDQVAHLANHRVDVGPDFTAFARQIRAIRANLERALHDEREPEHGVECFECGDRLVRRFRDPKRCRHATPARALLRFWLQLGYPEAIDTTAVRAARVPCGDCSQGGLDSPDPGRSWECPTCRKEYTPGQYATAVRRDLLENGAAGDGWTHITMAAEAASTLTGYLVLEGTVRKWMDLNKVAGLCLWERGAVWGQRLVYWPDVADRAVAAMERMQALAAARRRYAEEDQRLALAIAKGEDPKVAGKRIGINPARLKHLLEQLEEAS